MNNNTDKELESGELRVEREITLNTQTHNVQLIFDYEPHLVDIIVTAALDRNVARGDRIFDEYHRLADQIYLLPISQRENGVQNLQAYYFIKLGLKDAFERTFAEFPELTTLHSPLSTVMVSPSDKEEGCFLNKVGSPQDKEKLGILVKIRPARFVDPDSMARLLRHELLHLVDVLDPDFKYPVEGDASIDDAILLSRYALLWNISVDARLLRQGRETERGMEYYRAEFDAQFRKLTADERGKIFNHLWNGERPTHIELISWAKDPSLLSKQLLATSRSTPLPGSQCPLCKFPSYNWIFGDKISGGVAAT